MALALWLLTLWLLMYTHSTTPVCAVDCRLMPVGLTHCMSQPEIAYRIVAICWSAALSMGSLLCFSFYACFLSLLAASSLACLLSLQVSCSMLLVLSLLAVILITVLITVLILALIVLVGALVLAILTAAVVLALTLTLTFMLVLVLMLILVLAIIVILVLSLPSSSATHSSSRSFLLSRSHSFWPLRCRRCRCHAGVRGVCAHRVGALCVHGRRRAMALDVHGCHCAQTRGPHRRVIATWSQGPAEWPHGCCTEALFLHCRCGAVWV